MLKNWQNYAVVFFLILSIFILPIDSLFAVQEYEEAPDFNGNFIISDKDFTDTKSMTLEQIQAFLESKGTLGEYIDPAAKMKASFIIYTAAKDYNISPKVLLVLLQKEQSLVEDDAPKQKQFDWATGYTCYNGTCNEDYRGFTLQVRGAARRFMVGYWEDLVDTGCTFTNWCVGEEKLTQDKILVTPASKATAALYTYNPYRGNTIMDGLRIGANYNFWKIWQRWFSTSYPDGTLLKGKNDNKVYVLRNGKKRWITSYATLATRYDANLIIEIADEELAQYAEGNPIKFPLYALVKTPNGSIYLIAEDTKRMIVSWDVFRTIGFNPEEVEEISFADLEGIPSGKALTLYDAYPAGALLRDKTSKDLYYVESGTKAKILALEIAKNKYPNLVVSSVDSAELEKYDELDYIKFKDGALIKSVDDPTVYVISNGLRRPIKSEQTFNSYGYKWSNIIQTSTEAVNLHPLGDELSLLTQE